MNLTPDERRDSIAALTGNLGFQLLLEDLQECHDSILAAMVQADTDAKVTRIARIFQVFYKYYTVLSLEPGRMKQALENDLAETGADNMMGQDPLMTPERQQLLRMIEQAAGTTSPLPKADAQSQLQSHIKRTHKI